ncbi:MAG: outer membrane protein assembly factor BamB family protein [Planctomycetota bacterium]|jgi:outer membrane protein assembly factor BamB
MRKIVVELTVLMAVSFSFAADWPQFRGPLDSTSCETNLPDALDPNTLLWKTPLPGSGESTPVTCGDRIYLTGSERDTHALFAMCIDARDGTLRWKKNVSRYVKPKRGTAVASPSPAADSSGVVFLFSNGYLVKYDPAGNLLWDEELTVKHGPMTHLWNYSNSPLLLADTLYVVVMRIPKRPAGSGYTGSMASYLLVIDPTDGTVRHKTERVTDAVHESNDGYATPIIATVNGAPQIILYGADYITGHDPQTGTELWRYHYSKKKQRMDRAIPTPIAVGDVLYCNYPRGQSAFACSLSKLAAGTDPVLWTYEKTTSDVPSSVWGDGALYTIAEKKKTLTCLDAAGGNELWVGQLDKSDIYHASITAADGKLYMVNRKGTVSVVAADKTAFRLLSTHAFGEKPTDSSIAIANKKCYLRTANNLYCFMKQ